MNLAAILADVRAASENMEQHDAATQARFAALETSLNDLFIRLGRPGLSGDNDNNFERKQAIDYCRVRKALTTPKLEGNASLDYEPNHDEVSEALSARPELKNLFRRRDPNLLDPQERKSLSSFSFGSNSFLLDVEPGAVVPRRSQRRGGADGSGDDIKRLLAISDRQRAMGRRRMGVRAELFRE